ncbi:unnamed protein product, partial [Mesorhabditis belari]|uniref:Endonuclease/exonuclease/phosphatase domain-containing protein n=1 Tax=Mesorhabditis belari TaxID=2138241 RepID=A0AAF3ERE9_9BILA
MSSFNIFRHLHERENGVRKEPRTIDLEDGETDSDPTDEPVVIACKLAQKRKSSSLESLDEPETMIKTTKTNVQSTSPTEIKVDPDVITLSDDEDTPNLWSIDRSRNETSEKDVLYVLPPREKKQCRKNTKTPNETTKFVAVLTGTSTSCGAGTMLNVKDKTLISTDDYVSDECAKYFEDLIVPGCSKKTPGGKNHATKGDYVADGYAKHFEDKKPSLVVEVSSPHLLVSPNHEKIYKHADVDNLTFATRKYHKEDARRFEFAKPPPPSDDFSRIRLCSYNVLCQSTAESTMYLYPHMKSAKHQWKMGWANRSKHLKTELGKLNADVFGLQEVEADKIETFYEPVFKNLGYTTFYKKKTGEFVDGCLLAFRTSRFAIKKYEEVEYFLGEMMDRHQIGQICIVTDTQSGQDLCFANTHLLFNEKRGDIKLGQLAILFAGIHKLMNDYGKDVPVFITGDFNIQPLSPIYRFITRARVHVANLSRHELSGQIKCGSSPAIAKTTILPVSCGVTRHSTYASKNSLPDGEWEHPFMLASAYDHLAPDGEEAVSTYHTGSGNPDFIFYSVDNVQSINDEKVEVKEMEKIQLVTRLTLPSKNFLQRTLGCWPNLYVPSDHIPLLAEFAIKKVTDTSSQSNSQDVLYVL